MNLGSAEYSGIVHREHFLYNAVMAGCASRHGLRSWIC
jgi:hypothetical protein